MSVAGQTATTLDIKTRPVKKNWDYGWGAKAQRLFVHACICPHHNARTQRLSRVRAQDTRPIKSAL